MSYSNHQKLEYLKNIQQIFERQRAIIDELDFSKPDTVHELEEVQSRIDEFYSSFELADTNEQLSDDERTLMVNMIEEISRIKDENISRLLAKRDAVLLELKAMRMIKSAQKAYVGLREEKGLLNKNY